MTAAEFERMFKQLYMPLGMYALRILEDVDEAQDVVQEAFGAVWELVSTGAVIRSFKSYMYMSVRNIALMRLRNTRANVNISEVEDVTEEAIDTFERDARLWRAIDALPARCREIFLMSKRDGITYAEIADELGVSVKTVENQISEAYERLRGDLGVSRNVFFLPFL